MYIDKLVSVIIPTYNVADYLDSTLKSIVTQTYKNLEIIIVDDKSSDGTQEKISKWQEQDKRIVVKLLNKNSGAAVTRNIALEMARGRYIAFCDSDDLWETNKIEEQLKFMEKSKIFFSYTQYILARADGKSKIVYVHDKLDYEKSLRNSFCITTSSVMLDRNVVGDIRIPLVRTGQDHLLWWSIMKRGIFAYALQKPVTIIRIRKNSLSEKNFSLIKKRWKLYRHYEGLSFFKCINIFVHYAINGIKKYKF